eukprot:TRINITY_DN14926_c0_g1_i1.p1 TRINITY_DN14926_c0_g1~~TRINITY_DN14926_c0_g1_i1.p1  ORF type:complete len:2440 (+),score=635.63 TRINITY_DN14926_c0_g1_i1:178-7497(+)
MVWVWHPERAELLGDPRLQVPWQPLGDERERARLARSQSPPPAVVAPGSDGSPMRPARPPSPCAARGVLTPRSVSPTPTPSTVTSAVLSPATPVAVQAAVSAPASALRGFSNAWVAPNVDASHRVMASYSPSAPRAVSLGPNDERARASYSPSAPLSPSAPCAFSLGPNDAVPQRPMGSHSPSAPGVAMSLGPTDAVSVPIVSMYTAPTSSCSGTMAAKLVSVSAPATAATSPVPVGFFAASASEELGQPTLNLGEAPTLRVRLASPTPTASPVSPGPAGFPPVLTRAASASPRAGSGCARAGGAGRPVMEWTPRSIQLPPPVPHVPAKGDPESTDDGEYVSGGDSSLNVVHVPPALVEVTRVERSRGARFGQDCETDLAEDYETDQQSTCSQSTLRNDCAGEDEGSGAGASQPARRRSLGASAGPVRRRPVAAEGPSSPRGKRENTVASAQLRVALEVILSPLDAGELAAAAASFGCGGNGARSSEFLSYNGGSSSDATGAALLPCAALVEAIVASASSASGVEERSEVLLRETLAVVSNVQRKRHEEELKAAEAKCAADVAAERRAAAQARAAAGAALELALSQLDEDDDGALSMNELEAAGLDIEALRLGGGQPLPYAAVAEQLLRLPCAPAETPPAGEPLRRSLRAIAALRQKRREAQRKTEREASEAQLAALQVQHGLSRERLQELEVRHDAVVADRTAIEARLSALGEASRRQLRSALDAVFTQVDIDGDGELDSQELAAAGFDLALIRALDANGDGRLSRAELVDGLMGAFGEKSEHMLRSALDAAAQLARRRFQLVAKRESANTEQTLSADFQARLSEKESQVHTCLRDLEVLRSEAQSERSAAEERWNEERQRFEQAQLERLREPLEFAFDQLDTDGSGTVDASELAAANLDASVLEGLDGALTRAAFVDLLLGCARSGGERAGRLLRDVLHIVARSLERKRSAELEQAKRHAEALEGNLQAGLSAAEAAHRAQLRGPLEFAFKQIDLNGDGLLDAQELQAAGFDSRLLRELDANGDGVLSRHEFVEHLLKQTQGGEDMGKLLTDVLAFIARALDRRHVAIVAADRKASEAKLQSYRDATEAELTLLREKHEAERQAYARSFFGTLRGPLEFAFTQIDVNQDGRLDLHELVQSGFDRAILDSLDIDHNGSLTRQEFVDTLLAEPQHGNQRIGQLLTQVLGACARMIEKRHVELVKDERRAAEAKTASYKALLDEHQQQSREQQRAMEVRHGAALASAREQAERSADVTELRRSLDHVLEPLDALDAKELEAAGMDAAVLRRAPRKVDGTLARMDLVEELLRTVDLPQGRSAAGAAELLRICASCVARVLRNRHEVAIADARKVATTQQENFQAAFQAQLEEKERSHREILLELEAKHESARASESAEKLAVASKAQLRLALEAAFNQLDTDGSGMLDAKELSFMGDNDKELMRLLDVDGNGSLSSAEFVDGLLAGCSEGGSTGDHASRLLRDVLTLNGKVLRRRHEKAIALLREEAEARLKRELRENEERHQTMEAQRSERANSEQLQRSAAERATTKQASLTQMRMALDFAFAQVDAGPDGKLDHKELVAAGFEEALLTRVAESPLPGVWSRTTSGGTDSAMPLSRLKLVDELMAESGTGERASLMLKDSLDSIAGLLSRRREAAARAEQRSTEAQRAWYKAKLEDSERAARENLHEAKARHEGMLLAERRAFDEQRASDRRAAEESTREALRAFLEAAFAEMDSDFSGALDAKELAESGIDPSLAAKLDVDGDGELSRSEFVDRLAATSTQGEVMREVISLLSSVFSRRHERAMQSEREAVEAQRNSFKVQVEDQQRTARKRLSDLQVQFDEQQKNARKRLLDEEARHEAALEKERKLAEEQRTAERIAAGEASQEELRNFIECAFSQLDTDQSGVLDQKELAEAGFDFSLTQKLDTNGDGQVSRAEFVEQLSAKAGDSERAGTLREALALISAVLRRRREQALRQEREAAEAQRAAYKAQFDSTQQTLQEKLQEVTRKHEELEALRPELNIAREEVAHQTRLLNESLAAREVLQRELATQRSSASEALASHARITSQTAELELRLTTAQSERDRHLRQSNEHHETILELRQQLADRESDASRQLSDQARSHEEEVERLRRELQEARSEIARANEDAIVARRHAAQVSLDAEQALDNYEQLRMKTEAECDERVRQAKMTASASERLIRMRQLKKANTTYTNAFTDEDYASTEFASKIESSRSLPFSAVPPTTTTYTATGIPVVPSALSSALPVASSASAAAGEEDMRRLSATSAVTAVTTVSVRSHAARISVPRPASMTTDPLPDKLLKVLEQVERRGWHRMTWRNGFTLLHSAARQGRRDLCEYLVELGAGAAAVDGEGFTPADRAAEGGHASLAEVLRELAVAAAQQRAPEDAPEGGVLALSRGNLGSKESALPLVSEAPSASPSE